MLFVHVRVYTNVRRRTNARVRFCLLCMVCRMKSIHATPICISDPSLGAETLYSIVNKKRIKTPHKGDTAAIPLIPFTPLKVVILLKGENVKISMGILRKCTQATARKFACAFYYV